MTLKLGGGDLEPSHFNELLEDRIRREIVTGYRIANLDAINNI
jgi:hypothetical protein